MTQSHVFAASLASAERWIAELRATLGLPPEAALRALHALRAGLHAIRDRLPAAEVVDLGAQLPMVIRGLYYDGWRITHDSSRIRDRGQMVERVRLELLPEDRLDPEDVLRGVIALLVQHVSPGEIEDVVATLPRRIAALWTELAGHATVPKPRVGERHGMIRRTGYAR